MVGFSEGPIFAGCLELILENKQTDRFEERPTSLEACLLLAGEKFSVAKTSIRSVRNTKTKEEIKKASDSPSVQSEARNNLIAETFYRFEQGVLAKRMLYYENWRTLFVAGDDTKTGFSNLYFLDLKKNCSLVSQCPF